MEFIRDKKNKNRYYLDLTYEEKDILKKSAELYRQIEELENKHKALFFMYSDNGKIYRRICEDSIYLRDPILYGKKFSEGEVVFMHKPEWGYDTQNDPERKHPIEYDDTRYI